MKPENQRASLTQQRLQNAFLKLLQTKAIHQITIRELCAAAGINCTTFYNHYGSQYDLFHQISQQYLDSIAHCLSAADPCSRESIQQRVTLVLSYMADHHELSSLLLNNSVDPAFAERLFSLQQIADLLRASMGSCGDARERRSAVVFAIHGSYKLLQDWLNAPERLSPAEQAALMLRLARKVCSPTVSC